MWTGLAHSLYPAMYRFATKKWPLKIGFLGEGNSGRFGLLIMAIWERMEEDSGKLSRLGSWCGNGDRCGRERLVKKRGHPKMAQSANSL